MNIKTILGTATFFALTLIISIGWTNGVSQAAIDFGDPPVLGDGDFGWQNGDGNGNGGNNPGGGGGNGNGGGGGGRPGLSVDAYIGSDLDCWALGLTNACTTASSLPSSYQGLPVRADTGVPWLQGVFCPTTENNIAVGAGAVYNLYRVDAIADLGYDSTSYDGPRFLFLATASKGCEYASWRVTAEKRCFFDGQGSGSFSRNLSEIRNLYSSGNIKGLGALPGSASTGMHDNCSGSFNHNIQLPTVRYGYYSMYLTNQFINWNQETLASNSRSLDNRWVEVGRGSQTKFGFYSFSCATNNPYNNFTVDRNLDTAYNGFRAGVNAQNIPNFLDPASCPQTTGRWECTLNDPSTIGLDRSLYVGRSDLADQKVSVMRSGEPVRLTFGAVTVTDYNAAGNPTVITPGASGSVVRDLRNINYRDSVVGRGPVSGTPSTPWNDKADVNGKGQYFVRKGVDGTSTTNWDQWITNRSANENRDYNLHFNWASDKNAPFAAAREYQITADFLVPSGATGGMTGDGGFASGAVAYDWKRDTRQCLDKTGAAGSLVETNNPIVSRTNPVDILRSTTG